VGHDGGPPRLVLDAGTGITQVSRMLDGAPFHGTILCSHLHWDHTQGLPFFSAADHPDADVVFAAPAQGDIESVLGRMMSPPHFPIVPGQLRGNWRFVGIEEGTQDIEGLQVTALEIPHKGGRMFGYRVSDGAATFAYASDHGPIELGPGPDGLGEYHPAIMKLSENVDVLIHDAQYTIPEFQERAHFGHSAVDYTVGLARHAGVRKLMLFHHDPAHTDDVLDGMLAHARALAAGSSLEVESAVEGTTITVGA
jgi:phosphoribosyl 1,2-cyclic phosphodiesterase